MNRRLTGLALVGFLLLGVLAPATAQERSPADRQTLIDLAYVLGQSHALRQVCAGVRDQYWRTRMQQLVSAEQPDGPFNRRLADAFNDGFIASRQAYPACNGASRREAARIADKGHELAVTLSAAVADDQPTR
jgi:uncharacterized protein (TIGR02301 family)